MKRHKKLNYSELKEFYNPRRFKFRTTEELERDFEIIGQDKALKSMEFGLSVKNSKYNMYICGEKGTGKTSYSILKVGSKAKVEDTPDDWCYVYNFKDPDKPRSINLSNGMGRVFKEDIELLIMDVINEISSTILSEDYEKDKNQLLDRYNNERDALIDGLREYSLSLGFEISNTSTGLVFFPIKEGEVLNENDYEELLDTEKEEYEKNAELIQSKALTVIKKAKSLEKEMKRKLADFQEMNGYYIVNPIMEALYKKYIDNKKILEYLEDVKKDIVENISVFETLAEEYNTSKLDIKKYTPKYYVNLLVDNNGIDGAPVIVESNPTYNNLLGVMEYENDSGSLKTDFTMIKSGALHRANGGYLIIQGDELLRNEHSWTSLKRVLKTKEIKIQSLRHQLGITDIVTLEPEPIPLKVKFIIIGNPYIYNLLAIFDDDFKKLFKIKVDFETIMENNIENQWAIAEFVSSFCREEELNHFDPLGIIRIVEYSNRLAGSQKKLSTKFNKITEILIEADAWSKSSGSKIVSGNHVKKAIDEKRIRYNNVEEKIDELFKTGKIMIDVEGRRIGKINGLSIIDTGDYIFGKPSVITVSSYAGTKGIINIEKEADMSGKIHDKGVMILEGYLNEKFCRKNPLSITSRICFEQSYNGVDGDSASSTELYGILSSIGNIPLKQSIAVTGSINQKGDIQPVGGITEKIEGYFYTCKQLGFNGEQGVIIPIQNVDNLTLDDDVIEAVKRGTFSIYPISTIEEGIEILSDMSFNEIVKIINKKIDDYRLIGKEVEK